MTETTLFDYANNAPAATPRGTGHVAPREGGRAALVYQPAGTRTGLGRTVDVLTVSSVAGHRIAFDNGVAYDPRDGRVFRTKRTRRTNSHVAVCELIGRDGEIRGVDV